MKVGIALPSMVAGIDRATLLAWMRAVDDGSFSALGCGERIAYPNQEMMSLLAGAATVTERVGLVATVSVTPLHPAVYVAKQAATIDVLSGGRLTLGVGVGGRDEDYRALGASFARRHAQLDEQVRVMRAVWAGDAAIEGVGPVGPAPVQPGGPRVLSGSMGPKGMARAARWADGLAGFDMAGTAEGVGAAAAAFGAAWRDAGRSGRPFLQSSSWFGLGVDAPKQVAEYAYGYLRIFGDAAARSLAAVPTLTSHAAVGDCLRAVADTGIDEFILVATSPDVHDVQRAADIVAALR
jgi:alkanesulfonate monooxygenase SsuD/methylene tetrahydromethanopterin reductase-like flavin-dependent oxidoreductase (luciferase family)